MQTLIVAAVVAVVFASCGSARGQNDWQYPDPYFGIFEIEKSRPASPTFRARPQPQRATGAVRERTGRGVFRNARPSTRGRGRGVAPVPGPTADR